MTIRKVGDWLWIQSDQVLYICYINSPNSHDSVCLLLHQNFVSGVYNCISASSFRASSSLGCERLPPRKMQEEDLWYFLGTHCVYQKCSCFFHGRCHAFDFAGQKEVLVAASLGRSVSFSVWPSSHTCQRLTWNLEVSSRFWFPFLLPQQCLHSKSWINEGKPEKAWFYYLNHLLFACERHMINSDQWCSVMIKWHHMPNYDLWQMPIYVMRSDVLRACRCCKADIDAVYIPDDVPEPWNLWLCAVYVTCFLEFRINVIIIF